MTKSSIIKLASHIVFQTIILCGVLLSTGIGVGQELPKATLEQLAKIPASKFTKVIKYSTSPDKRFAVVLGSPDGRKPDWQEEMIRDHQEFILEPAQIRNYLVDLRKDCVTGILDGDHFGTGTSYNHESVSHHWSPDGRWLVETQSWKWHSAVCSVYRVDADGKLTGRLDFLKTADQAVIRMLLQMGEKVPDANDSGFGITVTVSGITDEGALTANLEAVKDPKGNGRFLSLSLAAKVSQLEQGELTAKLIEVKPVE